MLRLSVYAAGPDRFRALRPVIACLSRTTDMTRRFALTALILIATLAPLLADAAGDAGIRSQTVQFA